MYKLNLVDIPKENLHKYVHFLRPNLTYVLPLGILTIRNKIIMNNMYLYYKYGLTIISDLTYFHFIQQYDTTVHITSSMKQRQSVATYNYIIYKISGINFHF